MPSPTQPAPSRLERPPVRAWVATAAALVLLAGACGPARAQPVAADELALAPVFINDDPSAGEAFSLVVDQVRAGRLDQAVRATRELLSRSPDALVTSGADPDLHVTVRARLHALLRAPGNGAFLEAYRQAAAPEAEGWLDHARFDDLERSALLTPSGLTAALHVALEHYERGRLAMAARTLQSLTGHPDLVGPARAQAAALAAQVHAARPDPAIAELITAWGGAPITPLGQPPGRRPPARSALTASPVPTAPDLVPRPMFTTAFGPEVAIETSPRRSSVTTRDLPPFARELRTLPVLSGGSALVVNGRDLASFDLRTLEPIWRTDLVEAMGLEGTPIGEMLRRPDPDESRRMFNAANEDLAMVWAGQGDVAVGSVTAQDPRSSEVADLVFGFDTRTGLIRWSLALTQIDPSFANLRVRGPILIDNDTTVVSCRKSQPERRLSALYLIGLDTFTGRPKWTRLVGSAGVLPYRGAQQVSDGAVMADGLVVRSDRLGVVAAYEAHGGRPVWVRRLPPEPVQGETPSAPWHMNIPVVRRGLVYLVAPDRQSILAIDAQTGATVTHAPTEAFAEARYLLDTGDFLAAVGENRVAFIPWDRFGQGEPVLTAPLEAPGIHGRAAVAGGRVLLPVLSPGPGLLIADPAQPANLRFVRTDEPGSPTPAGDRLVVCDDARIHLYLRWDEAAALLHARLQEQPADPSPAVRLVEFAYAAGKHDALGPAVEQAVALTTGAPGAGHESLAVRLATAVLDMLGSALRPARAAPGAITGVQPPTLPPELVSRLLPLIEPACSTPDQRATRLILLSADEARRARREQAVEALQAVLASRALQTAQLRVAGTSVSAGAEATAKLQSLVGEGGRALYSRYDDEQARAIAQLPPKPDASAVELLAERFPLGRATPGLWLRLSELHEAQGESRAEAKALDEGLRAAARLPDPPLDVVGELGGRLISNLRERGLLVAAAENLRRLNAAYPKLALSRRGQPLDGPALERTLGEHLASMRRWPSAGAPTDHEPQLLQGWALLEPLIDNPFPHSRPFFVLRQQRGDIALYGPKPADPPGAPLAELALLPTSERQAALVRDDPTGAVVFLAESGRLARLDTASGKAAWTTAPFATLSGADAARPERGFRDADRLDTPNGPMTGNAILVCGDETTLALVQRRGRMALIDAATGEKIAGGALELSAVYDVTMVGGLLAVAGQRESEGRARDALVMIDARTGRVVQSAPIPDDLGPVRWLHATVRGELVVGLLHGVMGLDPTRPTQPVWVIREGLAAEPRDGWMADDRLLLRDENDELWMIDPSDGRVIAGPINARQKLQTVGPIHVDRRSEGAVPLIAVRSPQGVLLLGLDGAIVGADAVGGDDSLLVPTPTQTGYFTLTSTRPELAANVMLGYAYFAFDALTARAVAAGQVILPRDPERLAVIDDRLALTYGHSTIIYRAPAAPAPQAP